LPAWLRNTIQARVERGVERGTIHYDPDAVAVCLAAEATSDCAAVLTRDPVCPDGLDGTVPRDGECVDDLECAGDAYCAGLVDACTGRCEPRVPAGASCEPAAECAFGTVIVSDNDGCICRAQGLEGQSCRYGCQGSLECSGPDGRCARSESATLGQECDSLHLCSAGSVCAYDADPSNEQAHCVERAEPGGACTRSAPDMCPEGEWCRLAEPADSNVGICVPPVAEGDACSVSSDCNEWWGSCTDGACVAFRDNGAACSRDDECFSGACREGVCALDTCVADD
jgi:hypothetical protein